MHSSVPRSPRSCSTSLLAQHESAPQSLCQLRPRSRSLARRNNIAAALTRRRELLVQAELTAGLLVAFPLPALRHVVEPIADDASMAPASSMSPGWRKGER